MLGPRRATAEEARKDGCRLLEIAECSGMQRGAMPLKACSVQLRCSHSLEKCFGHPGYPGLFENLAEVT